MHVGQAIIDLAQRVRDAGGRLYVVGGCVRDHVLGRPYGDIDVEIHGLEPGPVQRLVGRSGPVGKSFGVYRVRFGDDLIDVALPQIAGEVRPHIGLVEAARRRDLRVNAMAWDPLTREVVDPHGGRVDLASGVLRQVDDETFAEDPLRPLRAVRFAVTLGMQLHPALEALCAAGDLAAVTLDRQRPELHKILGSPEPGRGFELLMRLGLLAHLGGLGDRLDHRVLDAVVGLEAGDQLVAGWALVLHGSSSRDWADALKLGRHGDRAVRREAEALAEILAAPPKVLDDTALRRLAETVVVELALPALRAVVGLDVNGARERAVVLGVLRERLAVLASGRDLMRAGVAPGPEIGRRLAALREEQLEGRVTTREEAMEWLKRE